MIRDLKLYQVGSNGTIDTFVCRSQLDFRPSPAADLRSPKLYSQCAMIFFVG